MKIAMKTDFENIELFKSSSTFHRHNDDDGIIIPKKIWESKIYAAGSKDSKAFPFIS
jgi:hypothetical protein